MPAQLARFTCLTMVIAAVVLAGCQTDQSTATKQPHSRYDCGYPGDKAAPKEDAKPAPKPAPAPAPTTGMVRTAVAIPTGDRATSGLYIEKMAPAEVTLNNPYEYTIKVTNLTGSSLDQVMINDTVSNNYELMSSTPNAKKSGGDISWDLGSLAPRETKTLTLKGKATSEGTIQNCVTGSYVLAACVATNVTQPALKLTKTVTPEALICDTINYEMVITNNGSGAAKNVVVVDELPDGLKTTQGMTTLKYNVGTLPAGQSRKMTARVKASKTGTFNNTANATADGGLKASAKAKVVVRQPVLAIEKSAPDKIFAGRQIEYTVKVTNTGDTDAKNVMISDGVPATTTFVSASGGGRLANNSVSWSLGTLAPKQSKSVKMTVRANQIGKVTNAAAASGDCAEAVTAKAQTEVAGIPAILLEVVDRDGGVDYDPIEVGNNVVYVITATNQGSSSDMNIRITATPENAEFVSATGATEGQIKNGTITFEPLKELGPKQRAVWKVTVKAQKAGNVRFKVTMKTDELGNRPVEETEATNFYE